MQLYYFSGIRFPSEKAHALYVAKCAESYVEKGYRTTIVVPRRLGRSRVKAEQYFNVKNKSKVTFLPTIDLFWMPVGKKFAHLINIGCFSVAACFYALLFIRRETAVLIASDAFVAFLLIKLGYTTVWEIHDYPEKKQAFYRRVAKGAKLVMVNTHKKAEQLALDLLISREKTLALPNGVDLEEFAISLSKKDARTHLGLPLQEKIVLYTGHLFPWKGAQVLGEAAALIKGEIYFVGGTSADVATFISNYGKNPNVHVLGYKPHIEMPIWLCAADVLVIPNSGASLISREYASPMKLFEYMASGRPIVASKVEAIEEVLSSDAAYYVEPDNPEELSHVINEVLAHEAEAKECAHRAKELVAQYTWDIRAKKMLERYQSL